MLRVKAETVAIRSSGQTMVEIIDAGTRIPPIPSPAIIKIGYITVLVITDLAPEKILSTYCSYLSALKVI
jgi:hypothetical protein